MANLTEAGAQGALSHKPNLDDLKMADGSSEEEDEEYGAEGGAERDDEPYGDEEESEIEDSQENGSDGDESEKPGQKKGKLVGKDGGVYKAPKLNAVTYEDAKDRKMRMKAEYERKRLGKTGLVEELKREMNDAPEELYMGGIAKKGKISRFQDALEREEMEAFRRVSMTAKEKKALRNKNFEEMQDRLENLDDDFAAIQSIVKRTAAGKNKTDVAVESAEKDAASSKFAKSLKQMIEKPQKRKKLDEERAARKQQELEEKSRKREEKAARKLAAQKEF